MEDYMNDILLSNIRTDDFTARATNWLDAVELEYQADARPSLPRQNEPTPPDQPGLQLKIHADKDDEEAERDFLMTIVQEPDASSIRFDDNLGNNTYALPFENHALETVDKNIDEDLSICQCHCHNLCTPLGETLTMLLCHCCI